MELILDASSPVVAAALAHGTTVVWTGTWLSRNDHTRRLMPEVLRGLAEASSTVSDIDAITVALGPGPFNGLRVAIAAAKGLAAGTGAAVCGINTLEAEAARCPWTAGDVRPVVRAGRSAFATARYVRHGTSWLAQEGTRVVEEGELFELATQGPALCGEIDDEIARRLHQETTGRIQVCDPESTRIETLARLGYERLREGAGTGVAALQPIYARPPHITQPRERRL